MPIKGLTDGIAPRLPSLGKLRKGGPKETREKAGREYQVYGRDLEYFRFDGVSQGITNAFESVYGPTPGSLTVYLPFPTAAENFATWLEEWGAGGLVHRCDGEVMTIWRDGSRFMRGEKPCPYYAGEKQRTRQNPGCKEVGRLQVLLPELIQAGHVGTVTLETHSKHDMLNILGVLADAEARGGDLRGVTFRLYRREEDVSTPSEDGGRATRKKWLVFIEPAADWVALRLAIAHANAMGLPSGDVVDADTGEIIEIPVRAPAQLNAPEQSTPPADGQPGAGAVETNGRPKASGNDALRPSATLKARMATFRPLADALAAAWPALYQTVERTDTYKVLAAAHALGYPVVDNNNLEVVFEQLNRAARGEPTEPPDEQPEPEAESEF